MNEFASALAGAITAAGVGSVTVARSWPVPTGRHRLPRRRPAVTVPLADLLGDEPEAVQYAQCTSERIQRPHLAHADGALTCTTCGHPTARSTR